MNNKRKRKKKQNKNKLDVVGHTCDPRYVGDISRKIVDPWWALGK
jgi:hypothetical protein